MRKLLGLGLVGLTGCANFCDTFFKARNVCRDQVAASVSAPVVTTGSVYGCSAPIVCSGPIATEVYSSVGCDCAGTVVMSPTCAGEVVSSGVPIAGVPMSAPPVIQSAPIASAVSSVPITSTPITTVPAGAVQPEASAPSGSSKPHPLLNPIRWMQEHHRSKQ
jgi:hypothetical protein